MQVRATTVSPLDTGADTIALGIFEGEGIPHDLPGKPLGALLDSGEVTAEWERLAVTHAEGRRFLLAGLGSRERFDGERARVAAAKVQERARELGARQLCWEMPHGAGREVVAGLVEGTVLRSYRFERFKAGDDTRRALEALIISAHDDVSGVVGRTATIASAQNRARELGNRPANDLTPSALAGYALQLDGRDGISVTVLDEEQIRAAGMGAFAAVTQGSAQQARLIELRYDGSGDPQAPLLALVGKGVTFDSGGLSLKPASSMQEMKFDMCGAAAVIETVAALAELRAPVSVLGIVGATENLPSSTAIKPGDIVTALDGTTIEINNTDAEGRLVLADCLTHARGLGAARLVDVATLTGAITIALGSTYAGLMSNDDDFAAEFESAAARSGELVWRLPLHERYAELIKGRYAALSNVTERREAGSITAAEFLHHFAGELPWAHIDIAGVAYNPHRPYLDKGASGFGVRLLAELASPSA